MPISLVWRRDMKTRGPQPLLLYGYGSYGIPLDPSFSQTRVSLLDRGVIFAIALAATLLPTVVTPRVRL